ncbi:thioredoxin domain-containing protein [Altererythrobacter sp.]|uniref:thioredoxin domain-containing protein n=1 Tax=Altererythrobacter sp. TaxID=1872480 RepID=UPI003D10CC16
MKILKAVLLAGMLVLTGANNRPDWNATIVETDGGHRIGNPDAEHKLTEYVSYTCSHCADFARQGDPALKLAYIHDGRFSVEIRHLLRDPIDLTAAMMTNCGDPKKFPLNHNAIMYSQGDWLPIAQRATQAQINRWTNPDHAAARRAIASDFGFYKLMEARGYRITDLDRCLNDDTKAQALATASSDHAMLFGIRGTPSFVLDGKLLDGAHSWQALQPRLDAALKGNAAQ